MQKLFSKIGYILIILLVFGAARFAFKSLTHRSYYQIEKRAVENSAKVIGGVAQIEISESAIQNNFYETQYGVFRFTVKAFSDGEIEFTPLNESFASQSYRKTIQKEMEPITTHRFRRSDTGADCGQFEINFYPADTRQKINIGILSTCS